MAHDQETKEQARDLYIIEGMTLEQVAREIELPETTIKRWGAEDGWADKRREYRQSIGEIKRKRVLLRKALIDKALQTLDPQDIYAASRLEATSRKDEPRAAETQVEVDRPKLFLEDMEFIAGVLKEIDPEGLKVFARNFEVIVERFKNNLSQSPQRN